MAYHSPQKHVQRTIILATTLLLSLSLFSNPSCSFKPKTLSRLHLNSTNAVRHLTESGWSDAGATYYGEPHGDGSIGGACGYEGAVGTEPFSSMITAGGPSLFDGGKGCGACYEVKCTADADNACSGAPVKVVVTDSCSGCIDQAVRFDLSGTAFGAMALSGQDDRLRTAGELQISYRRVECNYLGQTITFKVDKGSNPSYFATLIKYGDGNIAGAELKQALDSDTWQPMQHSWGATWKLDVGSTLRAPFSIRLQSGVSGKVVVAENVIPAGWTPGQTYTSFVTFN